MVGHRVNGSSSRAAGTVVVAGGVMGGDLAVVGEDITSEVSEAEAGVGEAAASAVKTASPQRALNESEVAGRCIAVRLLGFEEDYDEEDYFVCHSRAAVRLGPTRSCSNRTADYT